MEESNRVSASTKHKNKNKKIERVARRGSKRLWHSRRLSGEKRGKEKGRDIPGVLPLAAACVGFDLSLSLCSTFLHVCLIASAQSLTSGHGTMIFSTKAATVRIHPMIERMTPSCTP